MTGNPTPPLNVTYRTTSGRLINAASLCSLSSHTSVVPPLCVLNLDMSVLMVYTGLALTARVVTAITCSNRHLSL